MVDQIRTLLINPSDTVGYLKVSDAAADSALELFGLTGDSNDASVVDAILPLAMADDLSEFRKFFDSRISPRHTRESVYRHEYSACDSDDKCVSLSLSGLYESVLGTEGWWAISSLFASSDASVNETLTKFREAAGSRDAPYALGAVLLACAYRRLLLQGGDE